MKEILTEYPDTPEPKPSIVLKVEPRNGEEVRKLMKIERKNPRLLIMYSGPRK